MPKVHGVLVIARNGDRTEYHQDPYTYAPSYTESTPLGAVDSHALGTTLRSTYLSPSSPSYIQGIDPTLVSNPQVLVHAKAGGEGTAIFDSAIAVLQGLFPPTPANKIELADGRTVVSPLGGYQYVPVEMSLEGVDRALEPWVGCPAFEKHITDVYASQGFKDTAKASEHFFDAIHDYTFGRPTTLENAWNIYDYVDTQLTHNKTFAYRLPPTYINQARALANYHENAVFSDKDIGGIGNLAGRTILHPILNALQRIAFDDDPLRLLLLETSYQPFISLFHMLEMVRENPELGGIPNYASALAFELLRGPAPERREFLRVKYKNGTHDEFETYHVFGHEADIPVTEFMYRVENHAITSQKQWAAACSTGRGGFFGTGIGTFNMGGDMSTSNVIAIFAVCFFLGVVVRALSGRRGRKDGTHEIQGAQLSNEMGEKSRLLP
ncbi:phosphoglycerate mutase-like protein [Leucogyrophana mollusca]|uniref:Phosphoglycerate mutase-like protein n=1 Tax=Leucogyrophana mollusca TaxID=85980 RepID=A0ACB8AZA4_9AGAM|nr:phosphoglycerate mutase-like protein [Leucogyrophana mollusca]